MNRRDAVIAAGAVLIGVGGTAVALYATHTIGGPGSNNAASVSAPHSSPPPPSPVSPDAALSSKCVPGVFDTSTQFFYPLAGLGRSHPPSADTTAGAYQLTLTNTSSATAHVTGFAVVFYDSSGGETTSDQESASGFITPGQSLTWTEDPWSVQQSPFAAGETGAVDSGATCQLVQWDHS
jgi:hypothetical protein